MRRWVDIPDQEFVGEPGPGGFEGTIHRIQRETCEKYGITLTDLLSHRRNASLVKCRQEAYFRATKETTASYPQIARVFGNRDHTTIMWGVKKHLERTAL